ncbi:UNVERIFIED_CONTAM: hypothetical protein GTU68_020196 [Idotea baltica]|nr:hypothetical protein [Idotea baltica]
MYEIIGYIAAFLTTVSFIPQAIKTIKTKDTKSISLLMYSSFSLGVFLWLVYGIYLNNLAIILANIVTLIFCIIILYNKIKNDYTN